MCSTAIWREITAVTKDVAKEEQIPQTVYGWECDHSKVEVWTKDASCLALHLTAMCVSVMLTTALLA
jgi:hypothetical protein